MQVSCLSLSSNATLMYYAPSPSGKSSLFSRFIIGEQKKSQGRSVEESHFDIGGSRRQRGSKWLWQTTMRWLVRTNQSLTSFFFTTTILPFKMAGTSEKGLNPLEQFYLVSNNEEAKSISQVSFARSILTLILSFSTASAYSGLERNSASVAICFCPSLEQVESYPTLRFSNGEWRREGKLQVSKANQVESLLLWIDLLCIHCRTWSLSCRNNWQETLSNFDFLERPCRSLLSLLCRPASGESKKTSCLHLEVANWLHFPLSTPLCPHARTTT